MMLKKWIWVFYPFEMLLFKCVLKTLINYDFFIHFIISTYMYGVKNVKYILKFRKISKIKIGEHKT